MCVKQVETSPLLPTPSFLTMEINNKEKTFFLNIEVLVRSYFFFFSPIIYFFPIWFFLLNSNVLYLDEVDCPFYLINWEIIQVIYSDTIHCLNGNQNSGFLMKIHCHMLQVYGPIIDQILLFVHHDTWFLIAFLRY